MTTNHEIQFPRRQYAGGISEEQLASCDGECFICKRPLNTENAMWVQVINGGLDAAPLGADVDHDAPSYMGWFAIGQHCARRIPTTHKCKAADRWPTRVIDASDLQHPDNDDATMSDYLQAGLESWINERIQCVGAASNLRPHPDYRSHAPVALESLKAALHTYLQTLVVDLA